VDFWTREDSQLELPAGAEIDPKNPPKPHPAELARWVREVRGGILSGAFYLERNMNMAVEAFFLGPLHGRGEKSEVFGEALLSALNYERRTKAALLVAERIRPDDVKELQAGLSQLRAVRNAMAHNSCWFTGELDDGGIVRRLQVFLQVGKQTLELDCERVAESNELMQRMIEATARLAAKAVDPQSDEVATAPPGRNGDVRAQENGD
jgi:hypothetical protein